MAQTFGATRDYRPIAVLSQALRERGHVGWAGALENCGTEARRLVCEQCGYTITVKHHCKLKACSQCLSHRAFRLQKRYLKAISRFREPKLWTLTIRSTKQLHHGVKRIREAFTKLRRRKPFNRILKGGIYAIEANPHPDGSWNVHIHILCEASFIPQDFLSRVWKEITGDSMIVDVRRAWSPKRGLKYLLEYLAKGPANTKNPWSVEATIKYMEILEDVRLIQVFGVLLGAAQRPPDFVCPVCGLAMWRVEELDGTVVFSPVDQLWWLAEKQHGPP